MVTSFVKFPTLNKIKNKVSKLCLKSCIEDESKTTLADAIRYAQDLKSNWIWNNSYFNPNQPSWIVLHGEERWDESGLDSIKGLFQIPTPFNFSHYLYIHAQRGEILCCVLNSSLDELRNFLPEDINIHT